MTKRLNVCRAILGRGGAAAVLLRASGLASAVMLWSPSATAQNDDVIRMKDGRELRGRIVAERFDRVEYSLRRGASTSIPWDEVDGIVYHAPQPFEEAMALRSAGLLEEALDALASVREIEDLRRPLRQETLYVMAVLRRQLGDVRGATDGYRELLEAFPTGRYVAQATRGLVLGLLAQGNAGAASEALGRLESEEKLLLSSERLAMEVVLLRGKIDRAEGKLDEARERFQTALRSEALKPWDRAEASLGLARTLDAQGLPDAAGRIYRELVELDASPLVLAAAWNHIADERLEAGRQGRDAAAITEASYGYLRGVVLYVPRAGDSREEFHRALDGAAQCFEYLSQLATDPQEKQLNRQRAADLRRSRERDP